MINIKRTKSNFEREPLLAPFGFKGGYLDELWQTAVLMAGASGYPVVGLGTQSVLWSDAKVFSAYSQAAGNSMMFLLTEFALKEAEKLSYTTPIELLEQLFPLVYEYGQKITGSPKLRTTFALNALVAVDNAAWLLYCHENGIENFDDMIPEDIRPALSARHQKLAEVPLISYGVAEKELGRLAAGGSFFLKIKIGADPDQDGDPDKMLEWDKRRLSAVHEIFQERSTPYTNSGHIPYYLDANGRYDSKDRLLRFLDHAGKIGALDRIMILEEPFPEELEISVHDIPVRLAADESAHSDKETEERIDMGYRAIALKPIAKTLSMSFKVCKAAYQKGIPCFCADLTVNPILVDWNKNLAARIAALPDMKIGVLESNGAQNYRRWQEMQTFHPSFGASWMDVKEGIFTLDEEFYRSGGGIFRNSDHYISILR